MRTYTLLASLAALALAGCATRTPTERPSVPSKPVANADWHNLGVSPSGNVLHEIDGLSIRKVGDREFSFRGRKTVFNPRKENFLNTPPHKVSVNQWVVDCQARTVRLTGVALFDENGRQIGTPYTYNDKQIRAMPIVKNSASYHQYEYVCGASGN
ncbi:surface-adhesin E family protein [Crenobacter caeni]|uniref:Surface-adhesin protein E-like domain-containing protein n=1 Tax=Crenobacter caeni TaxID=2705474 RepID=A0A6B2KTN4_9NEIS|nr:surface-adhesin E family protein [Crenobacter caeni]NDV13383.1 hypothetical protein [Crenobacter caeni]